MTPIKYILSIVILLSTFSLQAQNGWTRNAKSWYAQAAIMTFSSSDYYNLEGSLTNGENSFNSRGFLLYGEYGITDRFTAILDVPIVMLNNFNTTEVVAGTGSLKLGLKYRILSSFPLSFQVDFDIPTNNGLNFSQTKEPNELGMFEQINLPTSDGEFNIWTTLAASHSLPNGKTFGSIFASINFRTKSFSPQWQTGLEIGHLFFDKLYLIGKFKIQEKLKEELSPSGSFLYGEGTTFTSYGLTTMYKINEKWKLVASYSDFADVIAKKRNIYDGATFSLGLSVEY